MCSIRRINNQLLISNIIISRLKNAYLGISDNSLVKSIIIYYLLINIAMRITAQFSHYDWIIYCCYISLSPDHTLTI